MAKLKPKVRSAQGDKHNRERRNHWGSFTQGSLPPCLKPVREASRCSKEKKTTRRQPSNQKRGGKRSQLHNPYRAKKRLRNNKGENKKEGEGENDTAVSNVTKIKQSKELPLRDNKQRGVSESSDENVNQLCQ